MKDNITLKPGSRRSELAIYKNEEKDNNPVLTHAFKPSCALYGIRSVKLTHNNKYLIITYLSNHGYIRVIDLEKLELLRCRYIGHKDSIRMVAVTSDDKYFFTASWDGTYRRFDLLNGTYDIMLGVTGRSPSCYLDLGESHLITASYDSDMSLSGNNKGRRWNLTSKSVVAFYRHFKPRKEPQCIDIASDGEFIYSGSDDGMALRFDKRTGRILFTYCEINANIRKIALSEHLFALSATDGFIRVFDKVTGVVIRELFHSNNEAMDVRISKDETRVWSCSMDGSVKCHLISTGEVLFHSKVHEDWIWSICMNNNDTVLVSGSSDGTVAFVSAETGQLLSKLHCFPVENEFCFECPPDKAFPNGFFYTSNKDFIEVEQIEAESGTKRILDLKDPVRISYIDRHNLRNMVITRLMNNRQYNAITEKYLNERKVPDQIRDLNLPKRLRS